MEIWGETILCILSPADVLADVWHSGVAAAGDVVSAVLEHGFELNSYVSEHSTSTLSLFSPAMHSTMTGSSSSQDSPSFTPVLPPRIYEE